MKVAVIGGTGFVGSYVVEALERDGHDVSLLVRDGSEHKVPPGDRFRTVRGNVSSAHALDRVMSGCDAAVYCIGILREYPAKGVTFEALQFDGVVTTVDAARGNGVRRFLLMSANGVKVPGTAYQETKKRAEDVVLGSGLDATVFRPSVVFGDPRGRMEFASQLLKDMVAPPIPAVEFFSGLRPDEGQVLMSPVHVEDVADAFSTSLTDRSTIGNIYELGGPDVLSWGDMVRQIASVVGRRKWLIPCPICLTKLAATLLDRLPFFPVTRDQLTMLAEGNTTDSAVLESLIGRPARRFDADSLSYLHD